MNKLKYVVFMEDGFETFVIFPDLLQHKFFKHQNPISA